MSLMNEQITKSLTKMFEAFVTKPNKARLSLYVERLGSSDPQYVERACERIIDTRKSLPSLAELRELVQYFKAQDAPPPEVMPRLSEGALEQRRAPI